MLTNPIPCVDRSSGTARQHRRAKSPAMSPPIAAHNPRGFPQVSTAPPKRLLSRFPSYSPIAKRSFEVADAANL